ncbi:pseudouridine synthase family protein [Motiliproteus sp.]|uniref:pseudouridine synthase family protein n=1 Tax=Motiliproteus sp. TaxID=1898955 RepID=UPI003BA9196D
MAKRFTQTLEIDRPEIKAIDWLAEMPDCDNLSRSELKGAMRKGAVWLARGKSQPQRLRRASKVLTPQDRLFLYYDQVVLDQKPQEPSLVADQGNYSVWNKPCGMLCQGSKYGDHTTLYRWAETQLQPERPAFIVHRLDRATRGLVLLAHSKQQARVLTALFEQRQVEKVYRAIVQGCAPEQPLRCQELIDDRAAISNIRRLAFDPKHNLSLVEVGLETGRKHQIRIHLSGLGLPILGDRLYGNGVAGGVDLQLQCFRLAFYDSVQSVQFELPLHELLVL